MNVMKNWKGINDATSGAVELLASAFSVIDFCCRESDPLETGGILIGRYSDDCNTAIILEATPPPPDSERGHSSFVRGVTGLTELLNERWQDQDRSYYLGEWHFHPSTVVEPSPEDFAQMLAISRARDYQCKEPILLIIGKEKYEGHLNFRVFVLSAERAPQEIHRLPEAQG